MMLDFAELSAPLSAQAMLEAERDGKGWKQLGLLPAPHFHDKDGSVKVPPK